MGMERKRDDLGASGQRDGPDSVAARMSKAVDAAIRAAEQSDREDDDTAVGPEPRRPSATSFDLSF